MYLLTSLSNSASLSFIVLILSKSPLRGDSHNYFPIQELEDAEAWRSGRPTPAAMAGARAGHAVAPTWTHVRLKILPDGGVARLRIHGEAVVDEWRNVAWRFACVALPPHAIDRQLVHAWDEPQAGGAVRGKNQTVDAELKNATRNIRMFLA